MSATSDIYLISHVDGNWQCMGCSMTDDHGIVVMASLHTVWAHLGLHIAQGDQVPTSAVKRVARELREQGES